MEGVVRELNRVSVEIAELHSLDQVRAEAKTFGLQVGEALDRMVGISGRGLTGTRSGDICVIATRGWPSAVPCAGRSAHYRG